jgi:hypothetical protein
MPSTKSHMSNRSIVSINKEIHKCLENINTWSLAAQKLIGVKRNLLSNNRVDAKFYTLLKAMEDAFYNEDLSSDKVYVDDSDDNSSNDEYEKYHKSNKIYRGRMKERKARREKRLKKDKSENSEVENSEVENSEVENSEVENSGVENSGVEKIKNEDDLESDIDAILNREAKKDEKIIRASLNQKNGNNLTKEQLAALQVLDQHEKEQEDLDEYIMERRKQMQKDMKNPPKSEIKFTLVTDAQPVYEEVDGSISGVTIDEETVEEPVEESAKPSEEPVEESAKPSEEPVEETTKNVTNTVSISQQIEDAMSGKSEQTPPVVFRHTESEPAPINALTKLSANKRDLLLQQIFVDAKAKIVKKFPKEKNQEILDKKIKKECDVMLKKYMDTH